MSQKQSVIFLKNHDGNEKWSVESVPLTFAQNVLFAKKIAVANNEKNRKLIDLQILKEKEQLKLVEKEREERCRKIDGKELLFILKKRGATIFGTVSQAEIIERVRNDFSVSIERKNFTNFTPIAQEGEKTVEIKFSEQIKGKIVVKVVTQETK